MNATESQMTTNPQPTSDEGQTETLFDSVQRRLREFTRTQIERRYVAAFAERRPLNTTPPRAA